MLISGVEHGDYVSNVIGSRFFRWNLTNQKRVIIANIFRNYSVNSRWSVNQTSDTDTRASMCLLSEYAIWSQNELLLDILTHNLGFNPCRIKWMQRQIKMLNQTECSSASYRLYQKIWRHRYRFSAPPIVTQNIQICPIM
eukprot:UN04034